MTRLIMVEKTELTSALSFSDLLLSLTKEVTLPGKTTSTFILPVDLTEVFGRKITGWSCRLPLWAAEAGIILTGYLGQIGTMKVVFYNTGNDLTVKSGEPLIIACLYDQVIFRQNTSIEANVKKSKVVQQPGATPKKKRRS